MIHPTQQVPLQAAGGVTAGTLTVSLVAVEALQASGAKLDDSQKNKLKKQRAKANKAAAEALTALDATEECKKPPAGKYFTGGYNCETNYCKTEDVGGTQYSGVVGDKTKYV